ncbi:uncharacterized protein IUM83_09872 [Phytophthora cinnamomi]|uniref:uncharacterized protein n=1 Tax=Phytophthora cinnamomi TaxID=4785 RepID=UPI0035595CF4|nr:hypothetical protein IUM83_09872 [Phytophthora cinnamomi]
MISRLRLGGSGGTNNNNGGTSASIFGAAASAMSSISGGGSLLPGNSSVESAAATAAANHAASSNSAGAAGAAGLDTPNNAKAAGGGFFGVSRMVALVNQANRSLQTSLQNTTGAPAGKSGTQSRGSGSQDVDRDGQVVAEIFENERLEGKLQPMDPKQFSDRHAAPGAGQDEKPEGDLPAGYEWVTDWEIDQNYTAVDRDGWTYAADFVEITEKDMLANEEQRALNAETAAQNQALEEKAKALATARMRYKRDNKQLAAAVEDAKKRLEQHKAQANMDSQDPVARDLKNEMDRVRQLHAKLEAVRQHRLVVEEESKALFNQVVEKKADLKFKSKQKMETALSDVDAKIKKLKEEQASVSKSLAQKPEGDALRKINARRNDIRSELGALKERRTMLLAEKRKQEGVEL